MGEIAETAVDELTAALYPELRRLARRAMRGERGNHTLQTTSLIHEAYLRLTDSPLQVLSRAHFLALSARTMRRILIDRARARNAQKRGGGTARRISLNACVVTLEESPSDLLELDEALEQLSGMDPTKGELVKLRFYAGLTMPQAADVLGISLSTAERHWAFARAWLFSRLGEDQDEHKNFSNR